MTRRVSVAEAKNKLPSIIHEVEEGSIVEITRYGKAVAMVIPEKDYKRMTEIGQEFWASLRKIMLTTYPNLQLVDLDPELADRASDLRAKYNLKTPDAIQIAATLQAGGIAFITNDIAFKRVTEIEVLMLNELIE